MSWNESGWNAIQSLPACAQGGKLRSAFVALSVLPTAGHYQYHELLCVQNISGASHAFLG